MPTRTAGATTAANLVQAPKKNVKESEMTSLRVRRRARMRSLVTQEAHACEALVYFPGEVAVVEDLIQLSGREAVCDRGFLGDGLAEGPALIESNVARVLH